MSFYSVESTKKKCLKRIKCLEEKQNRLIDRIVYESLSDKKTKQIEKRIAQTKRAIQTCKNMIFYQVQAKHG